MYAPQPLRKDVNANDYSFFNGKVFYSIQPVRDDNGQFRERDIMSFYHGFLAEADVLIFPVCLRDGRCTSGVA